MAAKRRKLSEAKLSHLTSKLEEQESYREERVLQERCIALLKGKSARQLRAIVAFMEGHAEKEPEDAFPRGVLMLGGATTSKAVPLYVVKQCLAEVMNCPVAGLKAVCGDSKMMQRMFCYAIRKEELSAFELNQSSIICKFENSFTAHASNNDFRLFHL